MQTLGKNNKNLLNNQLLFNSYDYKLVASNVNRQEDWWIDFTLDYEWGKIYPGKNYQ